jgi:hypothetical protein
MLLADCAPPSRTPPPPPPPLCRVQLNVERAAGRSFLGFHEGAITFPPTYKYIPGTDIYDERPEKAIRAPAWCDRVLWRVADPANQEHLRLLYYGRTEQVCVMPSVYLRVCGVPECVFVPAAAVACRNCPAGSAVAAVAAASAAVLLALVLLFATAGHAAVMLPAATPRHLLLSLVSVLLRPSHRRPENVGPQARAFPV